MDRPVRVPQRQRPRIRHTPPLTKESDALPCDRVVSAASDVSDVLVFSGLIAPPGGDELLVVWRPLLPAAV